MRIWLLVQNYSPYTNIQDILMVNVTGASTIFGLVSNLIGKQFARCYPQSMYFQPL